MRRDEWRSLPWVEASGVCAGCSEGFRGLGLGLKAHWGDPRNPLETLWVAHRVRVRVWDSMGNPKEWVGCPDAEKVGSPRETQAHSTHHSTLGETSQHPRHVRVRRQKRGKGKNGGGRKKRKEGFSIRCFPCRFREEKGGAIAPPFSCEMSDALSSHWHCAEGTSA